MLSGAGFVGTAVRGSEWPYAGGRMRAEDHHGISDAGRLVVLRSVTDRRGLSACGVRCNGALECQEHISEVARRGGEVGAVPVRADRDQLPEQGDSLQRGRQRLGWAARRREPDPGVAQRGGKAGCFCPALPAPPRQAELASGCTGRGDAAAASPGPAIWHGRVAYYLTGAFLAHGPGTGHTAVARAGETPIRAWRAGGALCGLAVHVDAPQQLAVRFAAQEWVRSSVLRLFAVRYRIFIRCLFARAI